MYTVRERREYLVHKQMKFETFCLVDCLLEEQEGNVNLSNGGPHI